MENLHFNPFEDRLSRDIRNKLSEKFAKAVETDNTDELILIFAGYRRQRLAEHYVDYIKNRHALYMQALEMIQGKITDPIHQGIVLWNLGLIFEVHEILEHVWYSATGDMKATLQALIRASGVYIKREYGFYESAARIATKAIPILEANRHILKEYFKPDILISALRNSEVMPPTLG